MLPDILKEYQDLALNTDPRSDAILKLVAEVQRLEKQVENWEAAHLPYKEAARMVHTAANLVDSTGNDDARIADAVRTYLLPLIDAEPGLFTSLPQEAFDRLPSPSTRTITDALQKGRDAVARIHNMPTKERNGSQP